MMNANNTNKNPYGHLLDKYLDEAHLDWQTKQQREKEAKEKYGNLLDYAKPDNSTLELMAKMEDDRIERRKQEAKEREVDKQCRQMRIEVEKLKEQERIDNYKNTINSIMARKEAKIKAEMEKKEKERMEAEKQQEIYDRIDSLMKISPEAANAYIEALKKGNVI